MRWALRQRLLGLSVALPVMTLLSGCGSALLTEESPTWQRPAWMAERIREVEEFNATIDACIESYGWVVNRDATGMWDITGLDAEQVSRDSQACFDRYNEDHQAVPLDDAFYRAYFPKLLDVAACIRNQGFTVNDPPSIEAFVDDRLTAQWGWNVWEHVPYNERPAVEAVCTALG